MICQCDPEGPEFIIEAWHKARKSHVCCECGSAIDPGERYRKITGKWGDGVDTFKQCEICANIWDKTKYHPYAECMPLGQMWEFLGAEV